LCKHNRRKCRKFSNTETEKLVCDSASCDLVSNELRKYSLDYGDVKANDRLRQIESKPECYVSSHSLHTNEDVMFDVSNQVTVYRSTNKFICNIDQQYGYITALSFVPHLLKKYLLIKFCHQLDQAGQLKA